MTYRRLIVILFLILLGLLAACAGSGQGGEDAVQETPSPTIPLPTVTPTQPPMAALVNGEGILLSEYEADLKRLESAQTEMGQVSSAEERSQIVLDNLTDMTLLAQAAYQGGFVMDEAALDEHIQQLADQAGGSEAVTDWQNRMGYTSDSLLSALRRSTAAAWQRDQIIGGVAETGEQIHARQILVFEKEIADQVLIQLQGGADFKEKSWLFDPTTGGDLGWFPRGYLLLPEIEEGVFNLQPGQFTPVIQTRYGYHIVEVIDRDPQHPLSPDAKMTLQRLALENWVKEQREQGKIEILVK